jgi:hypothetical protein
MYTLIDLEAGQTYAFAVTAYDVNSSRESVFSNEISITFTAAVPVASFSATPTIGPVPLTVAFTDSSTGSITSWAWDFGDNTTSTVQRPNHTYTAVDTYTVQLTVSGPDGSDAATTTIIVSPQIPDLVATLVAAYSFDEGSGTTVADASGNANDGTISGAAWSSQGKFGGALAFDGSNGWVTIADAPNLDLTTGMTLEAWVYPTAALSGWCTVVMKEHFSSAVYYLFANSDTNQPATGVFVGSEQMLRGGTPLATNTWTHLATTYNGTMQHLYVNGVRVASQPQVGPILASTAPLRIGGNSVMGEYFQGRIDNVRIYNRALSASEIWIDMNTPVVPLP